MGIQESRSPEQAERKMRSHLRRKSNAVGSPCCVVTVAVAVAPEKHGFDSSADGLLIVRARDASLRIT